MVTEQQSDPPSGVHPAAGAFPLMAEAELRELAADIAAKGLLDPIRVDVEGRLVDGRNRLAACQMAGVEPRFAPVPDGIDPVAYVISENLMRRNLTPGQRAMLISSMLPGNKEETQSAAAEMAEVSRASVTQAQIVRRSAPELVSGVEEGTMSLKQAYSEAKQRQAGKPHPRRRFSDEEEDAIAARFRAGETYATLSHVYGIPAGSLTKIMERSRRRRGEEAPARRPNPHRRFTDAEEDAIEARYRSGETFRAIAHALGGHESTIGDAVHRVRARRGDQPAPPVQSAPSNVVPLRPTGSVATPKERFKPETIQRASVSVLEEVRRFHDRINDLESRFGDDLIPALRGSAEGTLIDTQCAELATRLVALSDAIRNEREHRNGSTGN